LPLKAILDDRSLVMTLPRTVADVLSDHVVFEVESIDRMLLNVYVPTSQHPRALVGFIHHHLGHPLASTAVLGPISQAFVAAIDAFVRRHQIPVVHFAKGQRTDEVMHEHLARFDAEEGVLFVGRAQEKTSVFRTERRRNAEGGSYPWIVKPMTSGQASYDLRRLRHHGLITRTQGTHRYHVTDTGHRHAMFLTRVHTRLLPTGLAELTDPDPPQPSRPHRAAHAYNDAFHDLTRRSGLAP
jgi:hypothetical protein